MTVSYLMKPHQKINKNRQELRRDARKNPLERCPICGKTSSRHNKAAHNKVKE